MVELKKLAPVITLLTLSLGAHAGTATPGQTLVLHLKTRAPIETLAANAIEYGVTYSPDQIRRLIGPSEDDYQRLLSELSSEGYEIVSESAARLTIVVRASANRARNTFILRQGDTQPVIPAHLDLIDTVVGLQNSAKRVPHYKISRNPIAPVQMEFAASGAHPEAAAINSGGVLPATIKTLYQFDPIYTANHYGQNQDIAIATYDGVKLKDITDYYHKIALPMIPTVDVVSFNGVAAYSADSAIESELDAEFSGMIAPGAKIHIFASAENSTAGEQQMFTAILDDNRAKVVNYSWGSCEAQEGDLTTTDRIFARAVAQGVNITVASGDSGDFGCSSLLERAPGYPGSSAYIVSVGGTKLVNKNGVFETAWSRSSSGLSASGGGISQNFVRPAYQSNLPAAYGMRSYPDVALNADPNSGQAAWTYDPSNPTAPKWIVMGGTSIAAPQWAGFLALLNEGRSKRGLKPIGFINPRIYGYAATVKTSVMTDVTAGNNGYPAGRGWDPVTGWGSLKAAPLFRQLLAP